MEREIRDRLLGFAGSAERAREGAGQVQAAGLAAVRERLEWLARPRDRVRPLLKSVDQGAGSLLA